MKAGTMSEFRTLDEGGNLRDGNVNAYYLDDMKLRVAVARVGAKLFACDDIYEGAPLSGGLLTGTTLMSQCNGSQFDVTSGAILRGPAKSALNTYEVRELDGKIQARV
jgi:3-phenylpropionate/trans-cinnamate dioxygenase ferredoxin component